MGSLQKQPWDTLSSFDQAEAAIQHFKAALPPTEIPSLDDLAPSEIHNYVGQVVRWSLMVQDTTLGREVFAHRTAKAKSLLFREALETPEDDEPDFNSLAERDVFFCVNQRALDDSAERLVGHSQA